uniref:Uncharacterized protein n=1 Tax=Vespula pensylvanica TaxID=30213 RepID=A0A834U4H6_VESPE|nr:hypothetical protein H0235_012569 [Vespula pensylvanica]
MKHVEQETSGTRRPLDLELVDLSKERNTRLNKLDDDEGEEEEGEEEEEEEKEEEGEEEEEEEDEKTFKEATFII